MALLYYGILKIILVMFDASRCSLICQGFLFWPILQIPLKEKEFGKFLGTDPRLKMNDFKGILHQKIVYRLNLIF